MASVEEDMVNVHRVVREWVGFQVVNEEVGKLVREWVVGVMEC